MHFLEISDHDATFVARALNEAARLREEMRRDGRNRPMLERRSLAMVFEHPSLRTRVSFEVAMTQLGGHAINLQPSEIGIGTREPAGDVARVLAGMADGVMARLRSHDTLRAFAGASGVPVINGLTDLAHPCQAIADLLTLRDAFGPDLAGRRVCYLGDANNVFRSLAAACGMAGVEMTCCSPGGFEPADADLDRLRRQVPGLRLSVSSDPAEAVAGVDALYTDVWASMGQEAEARERRRTFAGFGITRDLLARAADHAVVLHCLPAHRGEEIDADVMDSPRCVAMAQAHNRLHAQKGLLATLLDPANPPA